MNITIKFTYNNAHSDGLKSMLDENIKHRAKAVMPSADSLL